MSNTTLHGSARLGLFSRISRYIEHLRWHYSREQVLIRKWQTAHDKGEGHTPGAIIRKENGTIEGSAVEVIAPPDQFGRWTLYGGRKIVTKQIVDLDECRRLRYA